MLGQHTGAAAIGSMMFQSCIASCPEPSGLPVAVPCVAAFTASSTMCSEQSLERQAVSHPSTAVQTRSLTAQLVRAALTLVLAVLVLAALAAALVLATLILAILAAALVLAALVLAALVLAILAAALVLAALVLATLVLAILAAALVLATLALAVLVLATLALAALAALALATLATAAKVIFGALLALLDLVAEAAACALVSEFPGALEAFVNLLGMLAGDLLRLVLELGEIWHGLPPVPESCGCHRQLGTLSARVVIRIGCQVPCRAAFCWPRGPEGRVILPHTVAGLTSAFHVGERTLA